MLAATMVLTAPMAYAAPFETDTGLAPSGKLSLLRFPVEVHAAGSQQLSECCQCDHCVVMQASTSHRPTVL